MEEFKLNYNELWDEDFVERFLSGIPFRLNEEMIQIVLDNVKDEKGEGVYEIVEEKIVKTQEGDSSIFIVTCDWKKKQFINKYRNELVKFTSIVKSWLHFENEELKIKIVAPYSVKDTWDCFEKIKISDIDGYHFKLDEVFVYIDGEEIE